MSEIEIESELVTFVEQARLGAQVWALGAEDGGVVEDNYCSIFVLIINAF